MEIVSTLNILKDYNMKIIKTKFKDLFIYKKKTYNDNRGYFRELFIEKLIKKKFPFDVMSYSKKNVIRGLHLQTRKTQGKLLTVLKGKLFDVALDCRKKSKTFGKYFSIILSEKDNNSIYIPAGFAHGFCTLKKDTILHYKCTNYRDAKSEIGILWNDPMLKIKWPLKKPIISNKDKKNLTFKEFKKNLKIK
jgi:dTDP-4-dehydrorhamnose 3,5-epimerase